jgi:hypothetical protein
VRTLVLVAAVLVFGAGSARADVSQLPPLVSWRAPAGCADGDALAHRVAELALPDAATRKAPYAVAQVDADAGGYIARITLSTAEGVTKRTRRAPTCDELAESVAQLLAMAWRSSVSGPTLLDWHAPDECPDRLELRAQIISRAGSKATASAPSASVEVASDPTGYRAVVRLDAGQSFETREVHGATCAEAADAVVWIIALAWTEPPKPAPVPVVPPRPAKPSSWQLLAAARTAFDAGSLPGADAGVGVAVGVAHVRGIEVDLSGTLWANRFDPVMDGATAGVDVSLSALAAQVCLTHWYACAGIEAGSIGGRAVELQDGRSATLLWLAATAGARARYRLTSTLDALFDAGIVVPLGRPEFTFDGGGVVFRPAPVAARVGLALEFALFQ